MQLNQRDIADGTTLDADLCMIGAGPAGVTLACEIARRNRLSAILLEAGGPRYDSDVQAIYRGSTSQPSAHATPDLYRRRQLGGSSTIWGGRCVPLDAIDFEPRSFVPHSGWPIDATTLAPFYASAMSYCEAGSSDFDSTRSLPDKRAMLQGLGGGPVDVSTIERFSAPTNFGKRYAKELRDSHNVRVILHTTATSIDEPADQLGVVTCATATGGHFKVRARAIIVCVGGLETVRTLKQTEGVRTNDNIGRYYMCHIESTPAALHLAPHETDIVWNLERTIDGVYARRRFSLTQDAQRTAETLNTIGRLHYSDAFDARHRDPILSAIYLTKQFLVPEYRRKFTMVERTEMTKCASASQSLSTLRRLWPHARNIVRDLPGLLTFAGPWVVNRHLRYRRIPLVALRSKRGIYPLDINAEQVPNPESRVRLNGSKDRFGIPKLHVDWRTTEQDVTSLRNWLKVLQRGVRDAGAGDIIGTGGDENFGDISVVPVGGHHIGTARMAASRRDGVVDKNLKCFDSKSIYVAGSAVFPTSGSANPTLTIVALAIRLAAHLNETFESRGEAACH